MDPLVGTGKSLSPNDLPNRTSSVPFEDVSASDCEIFISYRHDPDEVLAAALKKQLESSLEPVPRVFVSGSQGLRPSSISWGVQLQKAVQKAKAIIGIITQESKQREWIFFEAGAAWGRGIIYSPLLIDTNLNDVADSLSGYQATRAEDSAQFEQLLKSLAEALGSSVKKPLRFQQIKGAIRAYRGLDVTLRDDGMGARSGDVAKEINRAVELMLEGNREEAQQILQEQAARASTPDDKMLVRALQLRNNDNPSDNASFLLKLDELDESLKSTAEYHYWRGNAEASPIRQMEHLSRCLAMNGRPSSRRDAYVSVAELQHSLGRSAIAERTLLDGILGKDRELGATCAVALYEQLPKEREFARLAALVAGSCAHQIEEILDRLTRFAFDQDWNGLSVFLAKRYDVTFRNGNSANNLGFNLEELKLPSLSYQAYSRAMERGVSVAKANIARLVGSAAVPLVGLKVLESHSGTFDAAAPHYPHEVRANLENLVEKEKKRCEEYEKHGQRLFQMFALLLEKGLGVESSKLLQPCTFRWSEGTYAPQWREQDYDCAMEPATGKVFLTAKSAPEMHLLPIFPGRCFFSLSLGKIAGFMALTCDGDLEGSWIDLSSTAGEVEWFRLARVHRSETAVKTDLIG